MSTGIQVRRAKLADAEAIADFVSAAHPDASPITRLAVAERFGQVGFIIAERESELVGLLGWQVENLVVRVTDFLVSSVVNRATVGEVLIDWMEDEGRTLRAEAALLFLPSNPSPQLVEFWKSFGYEYQSVGDLERVWREAAIEWGFADDSVMIKRLSEDLVRRPM
ncbi:MAG: hypothetical protein ACP5JG_09340 [Anaerolineae bacterium]